MIRVAMVMDRFPHEPFLAQQVAALARESVDVHVLCQIEDRDSPAWSLLEGVDMTGRIHRWPGRGRPVRLAWRAGAALGGAVGKDPAGLARAVAAERKRTASPADRGWIGRVLFDARLLSIRPDVVHFQFADLARRRVHVAPAVDAAFTASFRGYDLTYAGLEHAGFYDRLWPVLDGAHTLGHDLRRVARDRGCPPGLTWTLIPPAVDLDRFQPPDRAPEPSDPEGTLTVVGVGRLHWKKGYLDALTAIHRLRSDGLDVRYRIVGSGPDEEQVRWAIRDLDLERSVQLVGPQDGEGVRRELADADIFLHAALTEGFGNAVLEAQAMGLPVICTDAEGLAENVEEGVTGFVVPRRQPDHLAAGLRTLARDRDLRIRMGAAGRHRVERHFGLADQTEAFIDFFSRSIERRKRRRPAAVPR